MGVTLFFSVECWCIASRFGLTSTIGRERNFLRSARETIDLGGPAYKSRSYKRPDDKK